MYTLSFIKYIRKYYYYKIKAYSITSKDNVNILYTLLKALLFLI